MEEPVRRSLLGEERLGMESCQRQGGQAPHTSWMWEMKGGW